MTVQANATPLGLAVAEHRMWVLHPSPNYVARTEGALEALLEKKLC
jgi:hypothetical protein